MKPDYYEVLGIERSATVHEVKRAYRKCAMQYHPDRNPGDTEAEEKFKLAAEAYSVLSDDEKRSLYDRFGHEGLSGAGRAPGFSGIDDIFSSFSDIFGDLFGFGFGRSRRADHGEDLAYTLSIDFEEAIFGTKHELSIKRNIPCEDCSGRGTASGTEPNTCATCRGSGEVMHGQGLFVIRTTCPSCGGKGHVIQDPCMACHGKGLTSEKKTITINVPAGFDEGMTLRYSGQGSFRSGTGTAGDLYIQIHIRPHDIFERKGSDLVTTVDIPFPIAVLGGEVTVPTLEEDEEITVKAGTQHGDVISLKGRGVPQLRSEQRGSIHYVVTIPIPKKVNQHQRELLKELGKTMKAVSGNQPKRSKKKKKKGLFGLS